MGEAGARGPRLWPGIGLRWAGPGCYHPRAGGVVRQRVPGKEEDMRRALLVAAMAMMAALVAPGCVSTAAKQALYGVTGASPRYYEVKSLGGPTSLDRFKAAGVEAFDTSPMLGAVPGSFVTQVQAAVVGKLAETRMFSSVGKAAPGADGLLIRGKFVDYDPGGSALRAVGFGVDPFLTAQIEVVDAASNQVIGVAMVTGTVKSAVRTGPQELADGVAKAVKGLFERHHTKVEPEKRSAR